MTPAQSAFRVHTILLVESSTLVSHSLRRIRLLELRLLTVLLKLGWLRGDAAAANDVISAWSDGGDPGGVEISIPEWLVDGDSGSGSSGVWIMKLGL